MSPARHRICLMHPMDPRGGKLGGIETHVRLILRKHPDDFSILFVGVDEIGDCRLGEVKPLTVDGRAIDFFPVARIPEGEINLPGKSILRSTTFRFAAGALRHALALRRLLRGARASADLQRFEFAMLPKLLGLPHVQMVHGEGAKDDKMDSLIKSHWHLHQANERLALALARRVFCVNPAILARLGREFPRAAAKAEVMSVSVDTDLFRARPFVLGDGVFRIVFAGRLDEFKDPPLMFRVLADLHRRLGGKFEFHYVGTTDPGRYGEFAAIEPFTVRHGFQQAPAVAEIVARCHAGILTSYFEGMPCYLLETLSVGRPFCAVRLPQYDPLVVAGVSGTMVPRGDDVPAMAKALSATFAALWADIARGAVDPHAVHALIEPYSTRTQMARLFERHRELQGGVGMADAGDGVAALSAG